MIPIAAALAHVKRINHAKASATDAESFHVSMSAWNFASVVQERLCAWIAETTV